MAFNKVEKLYNLHHIPILNNPLSQRYSSCPFTVHLQSLAQPRGNTHVLSVFIILSILHIVYKLYNMWSFVSSLFDLVFY